MGVSYTNNDDKDNKKKESPSNNNSFNYLAQKVINSICVPNKGENDKWTTKMINEQQKQQKQQLQKVTTSWIIRTKATKE